MGPKSAVLGAIAPSRVPPVLVPKPRSERCPSGGPGHQGSGWMNGRRYGRYCDVKKPQLTIGYSAALTGEEKPRCKRVERGLAFQGLSSVHYICLSLVRPLYDGRRAGSVPPDRVPCYASTNRGGRRTSYPAVCGKWATQCWTMRIGLTEGG